MRISSIKQLTDNYYIKHILSFFWDFEFQNPEGENGTRIYRDILSSKDFSTIEEVYDVIRSVFLLFPHKRRERGEKTESRYLGDFSKQLYGDRHYWKIGTEYEKRHIDAEERRKRRLENYESIQFLYSTLGLKENKVRSHDLVYTIAIIDDLCYKIVEQNQIRPITKEEVYAICEKKALGDLESGSLKWQVYFIMKSVSYFVYDDHQYWLTKNNLNDEEIRTSMTSGSSRKQDNAGMDKGQETSRAQYTEEAKQRWGETEAWKEYESKTARTSPEERENALKGLTVFFARIGELKDRSPRDPEVQTEIAGLQEYITRHFYNCTDEIFSGLGKMYSADGRFKENIDKAGGPGTAEFASEAIEVYCQEKNG